MEFPCAHRSINFSIKTLVLEVEPPDRAMSTLSFGIPKLRRTLDSLGLPFNPRDFMVSEVNNLFLNSSSVRHSAKRRAVS
jgi:hypothetical protein